MGLAVAKTRAPAGARGGGAQAVHADVAQLADAPASDTGTWGFDSLHPHSIDQRRLAMRKHADKEAQFEPMSKRRRGLSVRDAREAR
jgi:hypothetical protein